MSVVSTDPISDMLARIRNALAVQKTEISLPHSNTKEAVARLLKSNRYIDDVKVMDASIGKSLLLSLRGEDSNAHITEIVRLSKPGRRLYTSADKMPTVKQGRGIIIVSTSKGIMTGYEAKKQRVGGELICKVY
ncbi:MAG TPA: 30S ribosomal protein S8 [Candidatus Saccharimonadales bacterium]|nr:30S ribosomal protein S8 [Candidatus Saccharimonadales bacterium]